MKDPETPAEWQECVDQAEFFLALESCRMFGLITGGPKVNAERCAEILRRGEEKGYKPAEFDVLLKKFQSLLAG